MTADLTPVQQLQSEMGVEFYEWDGWPWPSNFGNPVEARRPAAPRRLPLAAASEPRLLRAGLCADRDQRPRLDRLRARADGAALAGG